MALTKLKLDNWDVDTYISKFRHLANLAGYGLNKKGTLKLFTDGIPDGTVWKIIDQLSPGNFDEWVATLKAKQATYHEYRARKGGEMKNFGRKVRGRTQDQWRQLLKLPNNNRSLRNDQVIPMDVANTRVAYK